MELIPVEGEELLEVVGGWLAEPKNYRWLDFGNGTQLLTPVSLKIMTQRGIHVLRAFTPDEETCPIGVIGLANVDRLFKTATIWIVLGERKYGGRGYPIRAASKMLTLGFTELGLRAINAWAVECNHASLRSLKRLNFRLIGRQRQCHYLDGRSYDRLLFDILAAEHKEL